VAGGQRQRSGTVWEERSKDDVVIRSRIFITGGSQEHEPAKVVFNSVQDVNRQNFLGR
jgi:hypothetical protein